MMTTVPGPLIWEIEKRNNSFLVKQFGNGNGSVRFSKESNNLYNLNSYKHSGLANKKIVTIQLGKENAVVISTDKTKKQNEPALLRNKSVLKKYFSRMVKAVSNQICQQSMMRTSLCKCLSLACEKYGRKDLSYQKWRWQPHHLEENGSGLGIIWKLRCYF